MNVKKLKRQLRIGRWSAEARNLEHKIAEMGLPLQVNKLRIRLAMPDEVEGVVKTEGGVVYKDGYLHADKTSPPPLVAIILPEGRIMATEERCLFTSPTPRAGPKCIYEDGLPMVTTSIRLPKSLRQRLEDAYPGESIGQILRDVVDAHLRTIGR